MSTVEEIEAAIERLPRDQFFRLVTWLQDRFEDKWDREVEDLCSGLEGTWSGCLAG